MTSPDLPELPASGGEPSAADGPGSLPALGRGRFTLLELLLLAGLAGVVATLAVSFLRLFRGNDDVQLIDFSPGGESVVALLRSGEIAVWDVTSGAREAFLATGGAWPAGTVVAPGARHVAVLTAGRDAIEVWETATGTRVTTCSVVVEAACFSADGGKLAYVGSDGVHLYDLASRRDERLSLPAAGDSAFAIASLRFTSRPGHLTLVDIRGPVVDWNWQTGDLVERFDIGAPVNYYELEFSADGGQLAVIKSDGQQPRADVEVWDVATGERLHVAADLDTSLSWYQIALDGPRPIVAAVDYTNGTVGLSDLASGEEIRTLALDAGHGIDAALAPDGRHVVTTSRAGVELWDVARGRVTHSLWRPRAAVGLLAGLIGLVVWGVVWKLLRNRHRQRPCTACHRPYVPVKPAADEGLCPVCAQKTLTTAELQKGQRSQRRNLVLTLAMVVVLLGLLAFLSNDGGMPSIGRIVRYVLFGVGGFLLLMLSIIVAFWGLIWLRMARWTPERTWQKARQASGDEGSLDRVGPLTIWHPDAPQLVARVEAALDEARASYQARLARPLPSESPLRVVLFAQRSQMDTFGRPVMIFPSQYSTVFYSWRKAHFLVHCDRTAHLNLSDADESLRQALTYHLLESDKGFLPDVRLATPLAGLVARADERPQRDLQLRRMRAVIAGGHACTVDELWPPSKRILAQTYRSHTPRGERLERERQGIQFQTLLEYVAGWGANDDRRRRMSQLLDDLTRRGDLRAAFDAHFEGGLERLLADSRAWALAEPEPGYHPTPPREAATIGGHTLPLIGNPDALLQDRVDAIFFLGNAGHLTGAETLIELVADPDPDLAESARFALEMISGQIHGDDPAAWRAWWNGLPAELREEPATA